MITLEATLKASAKVLASLTNPAVKLAATKLIEYSHKAGVPIRLVQGLRTIAEQNEYYAQGRTQAELNRVGLAHVKAKPNMPRVTGARGGYSYHNFGLAIDAALLVEDGKDVSWDMKRDGNINGKPDWLEFVAIGKMLGLSWGGDWTSFKDYPHLDMTFGLTTEQLRAGQKPTDKQIGNAILKIQQWELEENKVDKILEAKVEAQGKLIDKLTEYIEQQDVRLGKLETRININGDQLYAKDYAEVVTAAKAAKIITTVNDKSKIELNILTMLYNAGVIPKIQK